MSFNFIVCYGFILYKKKVFNFGDLFILGFYVFSMNILPLLIYYFLKQTLILNISTIYILVGIISKIILILFTYWLIKHLRYQIYVPNKQYFLVVITEIIVLISLGIIGYSTVDVSDAEILIIVLLFVIFILIILNGVYFNMVYTEKMQYEKQLQKEKYIKQSLRLIQNISYDIDDKKHRIH